MKNNINAKYLLIFGVSGFSAFGTPYMRAQEKEKEYFRPYTNCGTSNENAGVRSELFEPPSVGKLQARTDFGDGFGLSLAVFGRVLSQAEADL